MLDFTKRQPLKCMHCGKPRDQHHATTWECPAGRRTRIGYTSFGPTKFTVVPSPSRVDG